MIVTTQPDLKPCPFCGESSAYFIETEDQMAGKSFFHVCCDGCEAESFGCYCTDKVSAAKEWNTRAADAASPVSGGEWIAEIESLADEMKVACCRDGGSYWLPAPGHKVDDWCGALVSLGEQLRGRALSSPSPPVTEEEIAQLRTAFDTFSKATSLPGGPSLAMQRHDPTWKAWKALCEVSIIRDKQK